MHEQLKHNCSNCKSSFKLKLSVTTNLESLHTPSVRNNGFPCNECNSIFKQKKNLQQHMKKQHGVKKYKCNYCNFRSDSLSNINRHEKTKH